MSWQWTSGASFVAFVSWKTFLYFRSRRVVFFEVEELCFSKWKSCAFRSGRVVLFEVKELCFSEWKGCAFGS